MTSELSPPATPCTALSQRRVIGSVRVRVFDVAQTDHRSHTHTRSVDPPPPLSPSLSPPLMCAPGLSSRCRRSGLSSGCGADTVSRPVRETHRHTSHRSAFDL